MLNFAILRKYTTITQGVLCSRVIFHVLYAPFQLEYSQRFFQKIFNKLIFVLKPKNV